MHPSTHLNHVTVGIGLPITLATNLIVAFSLTVCSSKRSTNNGACGPGISIRLKKVNKMKIIIKKLLRCNIKSQIWIKKDPQ